MRCPKCGAFLEQGKVVCNMCGTNSTTYVPEQVAPSSNDGMFSTGMNTGGADFSSAPPAANKYGSISTKKDYHNVELVPVKNGEKDIFDFFSENKKLLSFVGILLLFGLIALIGWKYYEYKNKPPVIEPVLRNLYYEVDDSFETIEDSDSSFDEISNLFSICFGVPFGYLTATTPFSSKAMPSNILVFIA